MLIRKTVSPGPLHGCDGLLEIQQISGGRLEIQQGTLYPAPYGLQHQRWITSERGESENKRKAKYYRLTEGESADYALRTRSGIAWRRSAGES